ncbi:MAG: histidine phosphatase family protein [Acidimicrobiales bacterium]
MNGEIPGYEIPGCEILGCDPTSISSRHRTDVPDLDVTLLRYITHPNVEVDATTPVPHWRLSATGRRRAELMLDQAWVFDIVRIVSSDETKAIETAELLAGATGLDVEVRAGIGEIDRSATGFVPPDVHEELADAFFAFPDRPVRGWETARDAQRRITAGLADLLSPTPPGGADDGDTAVVGHGGVGTLWLCRLNGQPIDRRHDQPGQGHYFTVDRPTGRVRHGWRPIDLLPP